MHLVDGRGTQKCLGASDKGDREGANQYGRLHDLQERLGPRRHQIGEDVGVHFHILNAVETERRRRDHCNRNPHERGRQEPPALRCQRAPSRDYENGQKTDFARRQMIIAEGERGPKAAGDSQ